MSKLAMIIKTKTQPGKRAEVRALWDEYLKGPLLENDEQELYLFCEDNQDEDTFVLVELYASEAALGKNAQAKFFADYMQKVGPLLAGQPEISMTTPVWAKNVEV